MLRLTAVDFTNPPQSFESSFTQNTLTGTSMMSTLVDNRNGLYQGLDLAIFTPTGSNQSSDQTVMIPPAFFLFNTYSLGDFVQFTAKVLLSSLRRSVDHLFIQNALSVYSQSFRANRKSRTADEDDRHASTTA